MNNRPNICLIGDIVIDVSLKTSETDIKLRMGGIVHAARALWALNIPYCIGYFAPSYLDRQITEYLRSMECQEIYKLGEVVGAPYVFLIDDVKEAGDQGYEFILNNEVQIRYDNVTLQQISNIKFKDYLIISGNFDLGKISQYLDGKLHIDIANNVHDFNFFKNIDIVFSTIFLSTSSSLFLGSYNNDFEGFAEKFRYLSKRLVLKENRGGSRVIDYDSQEVYNVSSQTKPIVHSVGVGDVYDATYISFYENYPLKEVCSLSAWIASEYASTTYPDDFKLAVSRILKVKVKELALIEGISLPWENRANINIYIAAPDFDFVDVYHIDQLYNALKYHNFSPRRPVRENGQMDKEATKAERQEIFTKDMTILSNCSMLIAVLLYNDPGTLIEIGLSAAKNIPTLVYDPYKIATNCMLTELPNLVSSSLDEIIAEIFIKAAKIENNE